jgi:hypothetical protein
LIHVDQFHKFELLETQFPQISPGSDGFVVHKETVERFSRERERERERVMVGLGPNGVTGPLGLVIFGSVY